jgi:ABC-2 type transport system ATP-binding protein
MIKVQSLTRHYGDAVAVNDVSFQIGDNEIVGLLGHNGAGKTTVMRMLSGYLEPTAGSIRIRGHTLSHSEHELRRELGYLPESLPVYPDMMVADYLEYVATVKGIPAGHRYDEVRRAITATDLEARALDRVNTLSRGQKQRVGVAQAILGKPRLLILDEPTNGLDPQQTRHMRDLIKRMARQASVVLSTHIMQEVDAVCDRVLVLRHGKLAVDTRLDKLRESRALLLRTDSDNTPLLANYLRRMPQVATMHQQDKGEGEATYILTLHDNADIDTAANNLSRCVVEAGAKLYQLRPVTRGLESLFEEIDEHEH